MVIMGSGKWKVESGEDDVDRKIFLEGDIVRVGLFPDEVIESILVDVSSEPYVMEVLSWPEDKGYYYHVWDSQILTLHACVWSPTEMSCRELRWWREKKERTKTVSALAGWLESFEKCARQCPPLAPK